MYSLVGGGKCVRDSVSGTSGLEMLLCDVPGGSGGKTERERQRLNAYRFVSISQLDIDNKNVLRKTVN